MIRRLLTVGSVLWLLLCVAGAATWGMSARTPRAFLFARNQQLWQVSCKAGRLCLDNDPQLRREAEIRDWETGIVVCKTLRRRVEPSSLTVPHHAPPTPEAITVSLDGATLHSLPVRSAAKRCSMPLWLAVTPLAFPPLALFLSDVWIRANIAKLVLNP
jgi:hypothetical protein